MHTCTISCASHRTYPALILAIITVGSYHLHTHISIIIVMYKMPVRYMQRNWFPAVFLAHFYLVFLFFSLKACHFIKKSALKRTNVWCTWKPTAFYKQEVDELTNVHKNKTTQGWNKWQSTHSSLHQSDLSILQEMFLLRATTARLVGKVYCQYMLLSYNYSHTIGASGK